MLGPAERFIGSRYLFARTGNRSVRRISIISVTGVALGVSVLLTVLSVMNGLHENISRRLIATTSHLIIRGPEGGRIKEWAQLAAQVKSLTSPQAISPFVMSEALLNYRNQSEGVILKAIPTGAQDTVINVEKHLLSGNADYGTNGVVVGSELAMYWGLEPGDQVRITSRLVKTALGFVPFNRTLRVTGIYDSIDFDTSTNTVFTSLEVAKSLYRDQGVSGLMVVYPDYYQALEVAKWLPTQLDQTYKVQSWRELNSSLFAALELERTAVFMVLSFIILIAAFNITNSQLMMTIEKKSEVGILMAMGLSRKRVRSIFLLEGFVVGLFGVTLGAILGVGLSYILANYPILRLPADIYYETTIPVLMRWSDFIIVPSLAVLICAGAAWYPAWKAAQLDPVEAITR